MSAAVLHAKHDQARAEAARAIVGPGRRITFREVVEADDGAEAALWRITAAGGEWSGIYRTGRQATHLAVLFSALYDGDAPAEIHLTCQEWQAILDREVNEGVR